MHGRWYHSGYCWAHFGGGEENHSFLSVCIFNLINISLTFTVLPFFFSLHIYYIISLISFFLTHSCGSITGNTSFRYLLYSSPMERKIVFFSIIWTIITVSTYPLSITEVISLYLMLSILHIITIYVRGGSGMT